MKRTILWVLLLCLLLSGCGKKREAAEPPPSLLGAAADMDPDAVLLRINGAEQPAWRYLYWLARACDQLEEQYGRAGQTVDWSVLTEEGTLEDYVKAQALADTALYAAVETWAAIYRCVPEEAAAPVADPLLTPQQTAELADIGHAYGMLYDLYCTPGSLLAPVEGELALFAGQEGYLLFDRILSADRGDREAARSRAEELFARLNNAADRDAAFSALVQEGDDPVPPRTAEALDPALLAAVSALEEGQYSGILESEEGFSVVRRLPVEEADLQAAYFDYLLQTAAEESEIETTEAYQRLSVSDFAAALRAERQR